MKLINTLTPALWFLFYIIYSVKSVKLSCMHYVTNPFHHFHLNYSGLALVNVLVQKIIHKNEKKKKN